MGWLTHSEKLPQAACAPQRTLAMTSDLCQHRLMVTAQSRSQVLITPLPCKNLNPDFLAQPPVDLNSQEFRHVHSDTFIFTFLLF